MFNLLVTGPSGWSPSRDSLNKSRVLNYTAKHLENRFAPGDLLDTQAVTELPTVFACENAWDGTQPPARVGTLIRVQLVGSDYQFDYVFDPDIPPIPNSVLFSQAADDLQIDTRASIPESSRNHWSIKDVDLFKVLLKRGLGQRPKPKVFSFCDDPVDETLVAVMMPFEHSFNPVYEALKKAIEQIGMKCQRASDIWENDHVIQDVALLLSKAAIVVCDLSKRNANVFYETGIAHALGREVVLIAQSPLDIPFDIAAIRYLQYLPNGEGLAKLGDDLIRRLETLRTRR